MAVNFIIDLIIIFVLTYIIGSVPFGLIVGKLVKGVDVREYGSGNIGATNVIRVLGKGWGYLVFFLDVLKGFLPTFLVSYILQIHELSLGKENIGWIVVLTGIISVLGHSFSCFLKFKGGKGVCTSLGVIIGLDWRVACIAYGLFLIVLLIWRYVSLGSVLAALSVPVMFIFFKYFSSPLSYKIIGLLMFLAIFVKHIPNIKRLLNHTESKFVFKNSNKNKEEVKK